MQDSRLKKYLLNKQRIINTALDEYIPKPAVIPRSVHRAIRHSIFNGGKRIRPILSIAACETLGKKHRLVIPFACAIELVHCSSLIMDDLPCMDNDDYRRGKPACHKKFGEDTAILASYAMLALAFEIMAVRSNLPKTTITLISARVAKAAGTRGIVGGEIVDLATEGKTYGKKTLQYIHLHKTAALIEASLYAGAVAGEATPQQLAALTAYGRNIGLAFQVADDMLDVTGTYQDLGKQTGKDARQKKATYPGLYGMEKSGKILARLTGNAIRCLSIFGKKANTLKSIAEYIAYRAE